VGRPIDVEIVADPAQKSTPSSRRLTRRIQCLSDFLWRKPDRARSRAVRPRVASMQHAGV